MGVSTVDATHVLIEKNTFDLTAWVTLDVEPNVSTDEVGWITFRNNQIKRGSQDGHLGFIEANGGTGTTNVHDLTITGNNTDQKLDSNITSTDRRRNVVFTNNTALTAMAGPVMTFAHVDGLTVTGNTQPLSSGSLMSVTDCTNAVTSPNP